MYVSSSRVMPSSLCGVTSKSAMPAGIRQLLPFVRVICFMHGYAFLSNFYQERMVIVQVPSKHI